MTLTERPNIVWLTLDSVRADRTTMGGYERDTTPHMQRIARTPGGRAFTNCVSHAMWSLPSDASILTGTYPSQHGTGLWNEVLPSEMTTIPERFQELGYRTIGLSQNAYCSDSTGLSRGFDEFEWMHKSNLLQTVGPRILLKYLVGLRKHSAGFTAPIDRHRPEFLATELTKRRLTDLQGSAEPFFMFVHTQGAHLPYIPPLPYRDRFGGDLDLTTSEAADIAFERSSNYYRETANGCAFSPEEKGAIDAMYDGVLAYADSRAGDLFDHLRSLDFGSRPTVFVVTGDHGEMLGEQGILGHQLALHDALIKVPLVVHGLPSLDDVPEDALVQHIDLMEVLLDAAGAPSETLAELQGTDPRRERREFTLSQRGDETYQTAIEQLRSHNPTVDTDRFHAGLVHAVRSDRYKWIRSAQREELYELPDESTDVATENPEITASHRTFLEEVTDRIDSHRPTGEKREMSDAMKKQLMDLGYVTD